MSKIFYVDDDSMLLDVFGRGFKFAGHNVILVKDANTVVESLHSMNPKPDVILLDIKMPVKDGFEILTEIKSEQELKEIPVVCFSNMMNKEDMEKAKSLGATEYIVKSEHTPKQVVSIVEDVIKRSKK